MEVNSLISTLHVQLVKLFTILHTFVSFLISTSLYWAICSCHIVLFSSLLFNIFVLNILIIIFLTTFSVYGLNKITDQKEDSINIPERANTIKKIDTLFKFSVGISFILLLILGFFENIFVLIVVLFPLFLGFVYSVKLSNNLPRLKDITGVKNLTIALSWAIASTFLPVIYLPEKNYILILSVFFFHQNLHKQCSI